MDLKPGDVVQLRSGGPSMTVARYEDRPPLFGQPGWEVCWMVQGALRVAIFPAEVLRLTTEPEAGGNPLA